MTTTATPTASVSDLQDRVNEAAERIAELEAERSAIPGQRHEAAKARDIPAVRRFRKRASELADEIQEARLDQLLARRDLHRLLLAEAEAAKEGPCERWERTDKALRDAEEAHRQAGIDRSSALGHVQMRSQQLVVAERDLEQFTAGME